MSGSIFILYIYLACKSMLLPKHTSIANVTQNIFSVSHPPKIYFGGGQFSVCVTWVTWVTSHHSDTKHWPTHFALPAPHPFEKGKRKWYLISLMNKIMHVIFSVVVVILQADKNPCQMLPTSSSFLQQARSSPDDFASLVWFFLYIKTFWLLRFFFTKKAFFMEISQKKCDI